MSRIPAYRYERHIYIDEHGNTRAEYIGHYLHVTCYRHDGVEETEPVERKISASAYHNAIKGGEKPHTVVHVHESLTIIKEK